MVFSVDYLDHIVVLILSTAIICMQMDRLLPQCVVVQEVVEQTDNSVGALACYHPFVKKVVHLQ